MKRFALVLLLVSSAFADSAFAQSTSAEASLSNRSIKIGEQVQLHFEVHYNEGSTKTQVTWPVFTDTLMAGIDIVAADSVVTTLIDRASVLYRQQSSITITSIDSGTYIIPPIPFIVGKDTVMTDTVSLYVNTVPVDTTQPIKDIKGIYEVPPAPPAPERGGIPWWTWALIGTIACGLVVMIVLLTRRKTAPVLMPPAKILLPHEQYIEELTRLGVEKLWSNNLKAYHISLAEIMRGWLVERYRMPAREMTTREIIRRLKRENAHPGAIAELERVLQTADLVKFAKAFPGPEENERNLQLCIRFVQVTALLPIPAYTIPQS